MTSPHPIPDDALDDDIAIVGKKGGGKSFTAKGPLTKFLDVLISAYPRSVPTTDWSAAAGYTNSGTADTYRSRIMSLELAVSPVRGEARAADWLFPLGDR